MDNMTLKVPINNSVCQCELTRPDKELMEYCCQEKVNKGNMTSSDYMLICREIPMELWPDPEWEPGGVDGHLAKGWNTSPKDSNGD